MTDPVEIRDGNAVGAKEVDDAMLGRPIDNGIRAGRRLELADSLDDQR